MGGLQTAITIGGVVIGAGAAYYAYTYAMEHGGLSGLIGDFFTGLWSGNNPFADATPLGAGADTLATLGPISWAVFQEWWSRLWS
jgi:hypothetical protein